MYSIVLMPVVGSFLWYPMYIFVVVCGLGNFIGTRMLNSVAELLIGISIRDIV
jgi:hypothetical protein